MIDFQNKLGLRKKLKQSIKLSSNFKDAFLHIVIGLGEDGVERLQFCPFLVESSLSYTLTVASVDADTCLRR
jgi:hypothetical protein